MFLPKALRAAAAALLVLVLGPAAPAFPQEAFKAPDTILPGAVLRFVLDEVSGQLAFNNEVLLAGVNRVRTPEEMTGFMYEADTLYKILKGYGLDELTIEGLGLVERASWWVGHDAELRLVLPVPELLARLAEQPALMARGSDTVDCEGELVYLDQRDMPKLKDLDLSGKIVLTPEHPGRFTPAFEKGVLGVISYENPISPLDDPDQVVFDMRLDRGRTKNKVFGLRISTRMGGRLRDMILQGQKAVVHVKTKTADYPWKADTVFAAIKGTSPEKKGLIFTAHLFERPAKIGANDNISGCVAIAEAARTLAALIRDGKVQRPERSIYFLWSEEGSGTAAFFKKHSEMMGKILGDINMDMVGENLDQNSAFLFIESPPFSKTTYLDSVAKNFAEYVRRTNIEQHGVMGSTPGERFPVPIVEKNGSKQSFKYLMQRFGGGSDHGIFIETDEDIPALMFIVWPDKWYHTDHDTPDKTDPTQLKRVAFIGACAALAVSSGGVDTIGNLARAAYLDRLGFVGDAYSRAVIEISARKAADGGRAFRNGLNYITQSVGLTRTALAGIRDLATGKPAAGRYLEGLIGEVEQLLPFYTGRLQSFYDLLSRTSGLKSEAPAADPEDDTLAKMVPVKTKRIALGDFFPFSEIFGAFEKDQALQRIAFEKLGAQGLIEMAFLMDGRRNLAGIRDLLSFEFEPVASSDLLKLARALETEKLISFK